MTSHDGAEVSVLKWFLEDSDMLCSTEHTETLPCMVLSPQTSSKAKEVEGRTQRGDMLGVISQATEQIIITPFNTLFVEDHFLKKAINPLSTQTLGVNIHLLSNLSSFQQI